MSRWQGVEVASVDDEPIYDMASAAPASASSKAHPGGRAQGPAGRRASRFPGGGNGVRRKSAWETTHETGGKVATAVGRWFGVVMDEEERQIQHAGYVRRKTKTYKGGVGGTRTFGKGPSAGAAATFNTLWDEDSSEASEDELVIPANLPTSCDYDGAMAHYRSLRQEETGKIQKPGWFGREVNKARPSVVDMLGQGRTSRRPSRKRHSKMRNDTLVAAQLQALPTFTPWFIYLMTLLHTMIFIGISALAQQNSAWADVGFPKTFTCSVTPASDPPCPEGFNTTQMDGLQKRLDRNIFVGPTEKFLVTVGAKFTPCMREDTDIKITAAQETDEQCGIINTCETAGATEGAGCCTLSSGRSGVTSHSDCFAADASATWDQGNRCDETADFIVLRPCCAATVSNKCELLTRTACDFVEGIWREDKQFCAETSCLTDVCELDKAGLSISADPSQPNLPDNPNQWVRFIIPLAIHAGLVQLVFILVVQWNVGIPIETQAGFFRVFLIYFVSGIGGYVISGIFAPLQVTTGADPAVYGLLAVMLVELFQSWQIVNNKYRVLIKLLVAVLFLLMVGTLPFVDNWSHIGGFAFGIVSGIVFLPYINFGSWDLARKRILLGIAMPLLFVMFILAFIAFYQIQNTEFCTWCKYLNCIPYTSEIDCDTSEFGVDFSVSVGL